MNLLLPLSESTLRPTLTLAARCFPTDNAFHWALPLSACPDRFRALGDAAGLALAHQWVMPAPGDVGRIIATFGLYAAAPDLSPENRFVALNWFCVDPEFRGQGLGKLLWEHTIREAGQLGARHLIFYSSTEEHHSRAEHLYLAGGCQRRLGPELPDVPGRVTFFHRALGTTEPADAATLGRIDQSLARLIQLDWDDALAARGEVETAGAAFAVAA